MKYLAVGLGFLSLTQAAWWSSFGTSLTAVIGKNGATDSNWINWGRNLGNTKSVLNPLGITSDNVANLQLVWTANLEGDISSPATVYMGSVYVTDWAGFLYRIDQATGAIKWKKNFSTVTGVPNLTSRTAPAISGSILVVGDRKIDPFGPGQAANIYGFDIKTGKMLWKTSLSTHPFAMITQAATIENGIVYVGTSSIEELAASNPDYPCCSFQGQFFALNLKTGAKIWSTDMVTPQLVAEGYSGVAIWGSSPAIDRDAVYIATGNNYTVPPAVAEMEQNRPLNDTTTSYVNSRVWLNSIIKLNKKTGQLLWIFRASKYEGWNSGCGFAFFNVPPNGNCPSLAGDDFDFGQAPVLQNGLVIVGQKSGILWALNAKTGAQVWKSYTGPGGLLGGLQWGTASVALGMKHLLAVTNINSEQKPFVMLNNSTYNYSFWSGVDGTNGRILWETKNPNGDGLLYDSTSISNNVVFGGTADAQGSFVALNLATGQVLWKYDSFGPVAVHPTISGTSIFWGSGYPLFTNNVNTVKKLNHFRVATVGKTEL